MVSFDNLDHRWLIKFVEHRVADPSHPAIDPEMAQGWCGARRSASACEPSCDRLSSNCASACTIPCPKPDSGSSRSSKATSTTTRYRETSRVWECSAIGRLLSGGVPFADGARNTGPTGRASLVLAQRWLPQPRALHPFPDARFAATHP